MFASVLHLQNHPYVILHEIQLHIYSRPQLP